MLKLFMLPKWKYTFWIRTATIITFLTTPFLLFAAQTDPLLQTSSDSLQSIEKTASPQRPVVGLALSGGGAKGLAHIGVLKVLEEAGIHVDVVSGVSMGSVVGGLYAINYTPERLEQMALETNWMRELDDKPDRRDFSMEQKMFDEVFMLSFPFSDWSIHLPEGAIQGQRISTVLSRYTWPVQNLEDFSQFPRPFVCVATDLETGEAVKLEHGGLAEAIRASMSIPSVFVPVELNGRVLIDGYVARNLPTQDARDLGADIVIAVDVGAQLLESDQINSVVSVVNQAIAFQGSEENNRQREAANILIEPDMTDITIMDFEKAIEIIQKGEIAARAHFDELVALADSMDALGPPRKLYYPISANSIYITELDVQGLESVTRSVTEGGMVHSIPGWFSLDDLELSISRIYGSGYFERVTYRLEPMPQGTRLHVEVKEKQESRLRFGFNYNSDSDASLRFRLVGYNGLLPGSTYALDVTLGKLNRYSANYFIAGGRKAKLGVRLQLEALQQDFVFVSPDGIAIPVEYNQGVSDIFLGTLFSTRLVMGGGIIFHSMEYAPGNYNKVKDDGISAYGLLWYDSLDKLYFGHTGFFTQLYIHRYLSNPFDTEANTWARELNVMRNIPLSPSWTFRGKLLLGAVDPFETVSIPHYVLGGADWMFGYQSGEATGSYVQVLRAGLQWEVIPRRFFILEADAGRILDDWQWELDGPSFVSGVGLTAGMITRLGPMSITYYGGDKNRGAVLVQVGYSLQ